MTMKSFIHLIFLFSLMNVGCEEKGEVATRVNRMPDDAAFSSYWYDGTAEVTSFDLDQVRYGEIRKGNAVLIFVTEPFSLSKQVKLDNPSTAKEDEQTVLKLNFMKKFTTGIYPYSMMLSAFTPVETATYPRTPKVTMSSQEWCGHVFAQMNLSNDNYDVASYSYFEKEGDAKFQVEEALLEDEVWNRLRLNYQALPTGEIKIIPGLFYTRMMHKNLQPMDAIASLKLDSTVATYEIRYKSPQRTLAIDFETAFPYRILGWRETVIESNGQELTSVATVSKEMKVDYWRRNKNEDSYLRDSLNLP